MGNLLSREKLLEKEQLEVAKVEFENGNYVYVRQMTAFERDRFEQSMRKQIKDGKGKVDFEMSMENFRAKLAVCTVSDEKGDLIFKYEDYLKLSQSMSAAHMEMIVNKAQELNAITEESREGLVKNSEAGPAGNSSLDSAVS